MDESAEISYEARPRWYRRKRARRIGAVVGGAILIAVLALWAPSWWRYVQIVYWQHQCAIYESPADQVCHESLARPQFHITTATIPHCWLKLQHLEYPPGYRSDGTAFLHDRSTPSGSPRLVVVETLWSFEGFEFYAKTYRHPTPLHVTSQGPVFTMNPPRAEMGSRSVRVFSGQPDPVDATHFTIAMEIDGTKHVVDGWVQEDDSVKLEMRRE